MRRKKREERDNVWEHTQPPEDHAATWGGGERRGKCVREHKLTEKEARSSVRKEEKAISWGKKKMQQVEEWRRGQ